MSSNTGVRLGYGTVFGAVCGQSGKKADALILPFDSKATGGTNLQLEAARMEYLGICCVEACVYFCYLGDSSIYVHERCCLGNEGHPLTYVGRRRFCDGPLTKYGIWFP
jgi:hypothetical protein